MKLKKLTKGLLLGGSMLALTATSQAALIFGDYISICDVAGTGNCTDPFNQFDVDWTGNSLYTDLDANGVDAGDTVVDTVVGPGYGSMGLLLDGSGVGLGGFEKAGYASTWELFFTYELNGIVQQVISPTQILAGYTGEIQVYYNNDATRDPNADTQVMTIDVLSTGGDILNFVLFGEVSAATAGYFSFDPGADFNTLIGQSVQIVARVDTNLDTDQEPTSIGNDQYQRQETLNGSVGFVVPTPGTLLLLGLGLVAAGVKRRRIV